MRFDNLRHMHIGTRLAFGFGVALRLLVVLALAVSVFNVTFDHAPPALYHAE